jgi:dihydropteroate synthase
VGPIAKLMGIVNVTPDSFSDGGEFLDSGAAIAHGSELVAEGADILDIGGESTRPGAAAVGAEEEKRRVVPVIEALAGEATVPVSIDTSKAEVAAAAIDAGAAIVNDVTALGDP